MKNIILIAVLALTVLACKDEKKSKENKVKEVEKPKTELVFIDVPLPEFSLWESIRTDLTKSTTVLFEGIDTHRLERATIKESAYIRAKNIKVDSSGIYRVSITVKKGESSGLFGLRISGAYPNRVDAVFDLEAGKVKGVKAVKGFENESATINSLDDGWYLCTVTANVAAERVSILFGSTTESRKIVSWEGVTKSKGAIYIVPTSLKLEKIEEK